MEGSMFWGLEIDNLMPGIVWGSLCFVGRSGLIHFLKVMFDTGTI